MKTKKFLLFTEYPWDSVTHDFIERIRQEIRGYNKEYLLNVNHDELNKYFVDKFSLVELKIVADSEQIDTPLNIVRNSAKDRSGRLYQDEGYRFVVKYIYEGSPILFRCKPNSFLYTTYEISVNEEDNIVSFSFDMYKQDPDEFKRLKSQCFQNAFANLGNVNKEVVNWNSRLSSFIHSIYSEFKEKHLKENSFFESINLKISPEVNMIFSVPTVKKKIIPLPEVDTKKKFSSEPTITAEIYFDIINVINNAGKKMETKPSLYVGKDEEGLRDQFLFILEDRYEGTTATGETFNKGGKTDILLKYAKDSSNLFIAECKFWKGIEEFFKAINQLFDRYLTWRDSKVALIVFVTNKDFSKVIDVIKEEIKNHDYFTKENGKRGETSYSYIFHLPSDKRKEIFVEIILFHFDK